MDNPKPIIAVYNVEPTGNDSLVGFTHIDTFDTFHEALSTILDGCRECENPSTWVFTNEHGKTVATMTDAVYPADCWEWSYHVLTSAEGVRTYMVRYALNDDGSYHHTDVKCVQHIPCDMLNIPTNENSTIL
jgi:hypothetical protein